MPSSHQCQTCRHYWGARACEAFSAKGAGEQIPLLIITGQHDHRKPFKGDNGIRWEPKKK